MVFTLFNSDDGGLFWIIVSLLLFRTENWDGSVKSIVADECHYTVGGAAGERRALE